MPCSREGSRFSEWAGTREALRDAARGRQTASRSLINLPMNQNGTIEDQIRQVDKILKVRLIIPCLVPFPFCPAAVVI